jgi:phosphate starvation-inducible protein PhoH and related proteins
MPRKRKDFGTAHASPELRPKTERQKLYLNAIRTSALVFGIGPAGTGKTFVAAAEAAERLRSDRIERLIITRPNVEVGQSLGFLPGAVDEKFDPYFAPVREILEARLGASQVEAMIKSRRIIATPLAFLRGHTFSDALVILDEAQNTTMGQMKMLLTRIGERTTTVINGDPKQQDIPGKNGLQDAMERLKGQSWVQMVQFTHDDVVRSGIAKAVILAYENETLPVYELPLFAASVNEQYRAPG